MSNGATTVRTPESAAAWATAQDWLDALRGAAEGGGGLWNVPPPPTAPQMPSAHGLYTGIPSYPIPQYNVPMMQQRAPYGVPMIGQPQPWNVPSMGTPSPYNVPTVGAPQPYGIPQITAPTGYTAAQAGMPSAPMPGRVTAGRATAGRATAPSPAGLQPTPEWFESGVAEDIKAGLAREYEVAGERLWDELNARGTLGNIRAGVSPAAGAALGELAAQQAVQVPLAAWEMSYPGAALEYTGGLQTALQNAAQQTATGTQ